MKWKLLSLVLPLLHSPTGNFPYSSRVQLVTLTIYLSPLSVMCSPQSRDAQNVITGVFIKELDPLTRSQRCAITHSFNTGWGSLIGLRFLRMK